MMAGYDIKLWDELMKVGRKIEKGEPDPVNHLTREDKETILATLQYYGASDKQLRFVGMDLGEPFRYRVFDWLGMCYQGRLDVQEGELFECLEMMVKLYILQKHIGGFVQWLRGHDSAIEKPTRCEDCIETYNHYASQTPEERKKEFEETWGKDATIIN